MAGARQRGLSYATDRCNRCSSGCSPKPRNTRGMMKGRSDVHGSKVWFRQVSPRVSASGVALIRRAAVGAVDVDKAGFEPLASVLER